MIFVSNIENLDGFLDEVNKKEKLPNINVASKRNLKNSKINVNGKEPDAIIFLLDKKECKVIELKDGDTFDTKKVLGEIETLKKVVNTISPKIPYKVNFYICGFNSLDKTSLKKGLKNMLEEKNLMTGEELCQILGVQHYEILLKRMSDGQENLEYFISELLNISKVKEIILKKLSIK